MEERGLGGCRFSSMATELEWKRFKATRRQAAIGTRLRRLYDDVVSQPVPDEWLDLLRRIDASHSATASTGA
jgi:hypothetical protein